MKGAGSAECAPASSAAAATYQPRAVTLACMYETVRQASEDGRRAQLPCAPAQIALRPGPMPRQGRGIWAAGDSYLRSHGRGGPKGHTLPVAPHKLTEKVGPAHDCPRWAAGLARNSQPHQLHYERLHNTMIRR